MGILLMVENKSPPPTTTTTASRKSKEALSTFQTYRSIIYIEQHFPFYEEKDPFSNLLLAGL